MSKSDQLLSGQEQFTLGGNSIGFSVLDYWRFQHSNIWASQEEIAEFIVAKALGQEQPYNKNGWTLWDMNYQGKRIEVKETGYYHSWRIDGKVSKQRTFSITQAYSVYKNRSSGSNRQNDVYVFCLNTGDTQETSNPLALENWRFWVVPTSTINRLCGDNKTISLGRVKRIAGLKEGLVYDELREAVGKVIDGMD